MTTQTAAQSFRIQQTSYTSKGVAVPAIIGPAFATYEEAVIWGKNARAISHRVYGSDLASGKGVNRRSTFQIVER